MLLASSLLAIVPAVAAAWQVRVGSAVRHTGRLVADQRGDLVVTTEKRVGAHRVPLVVKLAQRSGKVRWRTALDEARDGHVRALAVTAGDDVVAGGPLGPDGGFAVVRLAGADGSMAWQYSIAAEGGDDEVDRILVDAAGDVVAAGRVGDGVTVVKLDGADGHERWRSDVAPLDHPEDVAGMALAPNGDVVVSGGSTGGLPPHRGTMIARFDGPTGTTRWTRDIATLRPGRGLAVDADGAIALGGQTLVDESTTPYDARPFTVVMLDGTAGAERWTAQIPPGDYAAFATAVAFVDGGDVVASGTTRDAMTTVRLERSTGTVVWRHDDGGDYGAVGGLLAIAPTGEVLIAGNLYDRRTCWDIGFSALSAATGAIEASRQLHGRTKDRSACASGGTDDAPNGLVASGPGFVALSGSVQDPQGTRRLVTRFPLTP